MAKTFGNLHDLLTKSLECGRKEWHCRVVGGLSALSQPLVQCEFAMMNVRPPAVNGSLKIGGISTSAVSTLRQLDIGENMYEVTEYNPFASFCLFLAIPLRLGFLVGQKRQSLYFA